MSLLDTLFRTGQLRTLDHALARSLQRLAPDTPDVVLAAAALASLAVAQGHAGVRLDAPARLVDTDIDWPQAEDWRWQLAQSRWVATPDAAGAATATDTPLVLEGAPGTPGLLYLRRYREYERQLALGLQRIGTCAPEAGDLAVLVPVFAQLFPPAGQGDDRQARAAALALCHRLLLVTGGPGTGKTTTITRLLVLLAAQAQQAGRPAPRIALAAPTGRAAERMAESVRLALHSLAAVGVDAALLDGLPTQGSTLHRLLGTLPDSPYFRHHAEHPLPYDTVVVDEASMIDLPLMAKLVDAIATGTGLILIGDPDQLPSVEAGDVLSGILRAVGSGDRLSRDDASSLTPLLGMPSGDAIDGTNAPFFSGRRAHLLRGWRQSESLHLAPLAQAVRTGDGDTALMRLRDGSLTNIHFHEGLSDPLQGHSETLLDHWRDLAAVADPLQALALASRLRLLTAVREGPQGARSLNARIEDRLAGSSRRGQGHFHGRLLLITENSYRHGLFNGDIGICLRDSGGAILAWFPGGGELAPPRAFHPAALPAHESAFAMTVHKAQGSEFDRVWLLLPARINRVLSRELVYTGLTRARSELHLCASEPVLREALARHASRWSGLAWRLGATDLEAPP